jgi:hypothetical protein
VKKLLAMLAIVLAMAGCKKTPFDFDSKAGAVFHTRHAYVEQVLHLDHQTNYFKDGVRIADPTDLIDLTVLMDDKSEWTLYELKPEMVGSVVPGDQLLIEFKETIETNSFYKGREKVIYEVVKITKTEGNYDNN